MLFIIYHKSWALEPPSNLFKNYGDISLRKSAEWFYLTSVAPLSCVGTKPYDGTINRIPSVLERRRYRLNPMLRSRPQLKRIAEGLFALSLQASGNLKQ